MIDMKFQVLFSLENNLKKNKMLSATILLSALKVFPLLFYSGGHVHNGPEHQTVEGGKEWNGLSSLCSLNKLGRKY